MNVINRLMRKPVLPPDRRSRKANAGDTIVFIKDSHGTAQYWPHVDHTGIVKNVRLQYQAHRPSPRATYEIDCECGVTLNPRSVAFKVVD